MAKKKPGTPHIVKFRTAEKTNADLVKQMNGAISDLVEKVIHRIVNDVVSKSDLFDTPEFHSAFANRLFAQLIHEQPVAAHLRYREMIHSNFGGLLADAADLVLACNPEATIADLGAALVEAMEQLKQIMDAHGIETRLADEVAD
jgi:hypothetical protein